MRIGSQELEQRSEEDVRRRRTLARTLELRQLAERSLSEQVETLRADLAGLSDEDRALLDLGASYANADQMVDSWRAGADTFREAAQQMRRTTQSLLSNLQSPAELPEEEMLTAASAEYRSLLMDAMDGLGNLIGRVDSIGYGSASSDSENPWHQWAEKRQQFGQAYEAAVQRSSSHKEQTERLTELELDLQGRIRASSRIREELQALGDAQTRHDALRARWLDLIRQHDDTLDDQCASLTAESDSAIRARVQRLSNTNDFVSLLKKSISGSRVAGTRIDAVGSAISQCETIEEGRELCANVLSDLERLADYDGDRDGALARPQADILSKLGFTQANLDGIARALTLDNWLALSLTPIVSEPVFEFRAREQEYIPFENASAGQQATALLKTLLNQDGPPLVIDQPEEDLDNQVILEIVTSVWEAKQKRQLLFASHNANLVVNGDADLVAWCNHRTAVDQSGGRIAGQGAIDIDDVREAIKKIMEGGEDAFNLRKEKYGF